MSITLRLERPEDYRAVENLTREAFWGFTGPTCDEHYLVHLLRSVPAFLPELDFVAEMDGELVGNVMYSRAKVVDDGGKETEVLTFGPLAVLPTYWHCGVGSALPTAGRNLDGAKVHYHHWSRDCRAGGRLLRTDERL